MGKAAIKNELDGVQISGSTMDHYIKFCEDAQLNNLWSHTKREPGKRFAFVEISSCKWDQWWYNKYIGLQCFVELYFSGKALKDVYVIRLLGSKIIKGRSIDPSDITIL